MNNTIKLLQSFLMKDPADSFTRFALAMEFKKIGESSKALALFEELVGKNPHYVGTYYHYGRLLDELGEQTEARRILNTGIEVAMNAGDHHAASELRQALDEIDFFND